MSQYTGSVGVLGLQVLEEWFLPRLAASTSATQCGLTAADDEARANLDKTLHTLSYQYPKQLWQFYIIGRLSFYIELVTYVAKIPLEA